MDLDALAKQVQGIQRLVALRPRIEAMLADYEARKGAAGEPEAARDQAIKPATDGPASETTAA